MKQAELPASPAEGLLVYQTDNTPGFYYYSSGQWHLINSNTGAASGGSIIPFASGPTPVDFIALGRPEAASEVIGFGSYTSFIITEADVLDLNQSAGSEGFMMPRAGIVTSISVFFCTTKPTSYTGTFTIIGQLYKSDDGTRAFPIPGATVTFGPTPSGIIVQGTTFTDIQTGLSIPVTPGTRLYMVYTMHGSVNSDAPSLSGTISGGLNIQ